MANPSRLDKIQITGNSNSATATKVNVQEANGEVNTQTINTGFNKNIGLGGSDVVGANTLLNQYSTTPVDWTATAFNSGQVVFYGGKQWIAKIATVAGDVPAVSSKWEEITFEALSNKTVIVDAIPTDGSNNAVSSNGVFDALATKAPISLAHNPVTIGTANGLSLSTQRLSLGLASSGVTGALSGTDWNVFNNKQNNLVSGTNIKTIEGQSLLGSGNIDLVKADVGLSNADNTSDANKPISIATQTALDSKAPVSGSANYIQNQAATPQSANMWINGRIAWGNSVDNGYMESSPSNGTNFVGKTGSTNDFVFHNGLGQGVIENPTGTQNVVFKGSISASPAVSPNQVPTLGQVQAIAGRPYKVYTALLTQTGSSVPIATVIENTLGSTISYSFGGTGFVVATSSGSSFVDPNKVFISISNGNGAGFFSVFRIQNNQVRIVQQSISGAATDGLLHTANFEIRVYN